MTKQHVAWFLIIFWALMACWGLNTLAKYRAERIGHITRDVNV